MLKKQIRKEYAAQRDALSDRQREIMSQAIMEQLQHLKHPSPGVLMSYFPIPGRNEFDVTLCENWFRQHYPKLTIALPRLDADNVTMNAVPVQKDSVLV